MTQYKAIRRKHARRRNRTRGLRSPLAPALQRTKPDAEDLASKRNRVPAVHARHHVVVEPILHQRVLPLRELQDWRVPAMSERRLQRLELRCEAFGDGLSRHDGSAVLSVCRTCELTLGSRTSPACSSFVVSVARLRGATTRSGARLVPTRTTECGPSTPGATA